MDLFWIRRCTAVEAGGDGDSALAGCGGFLHCGDQFGQGFLRRIGSGPIRGRPAKDADKNEWQRQPKTTSHAHLPVIHVSEWQNLECTVGTCFCSQAGRIKGLGRALPAYPPSAKLLTPHPQAGHHHLEGSEFLLEMLGRSRLRAPALAEFLKSAVDQVSRIQILHHLWPHDVVLG